MAIPILFAQHSVYRDKTRISIKNILDDGVPSVNSLVGTVVRIFVGKTSEDGVIVDSCSRIITQPRFVVNHIDTAE